MQSRGTTRWRRCWTSQRVRRNNAHRQSGRGQSRTPTCESPWQDGRSIAAEGIQLGVEVRVLQEVISEVGGLLEAIAEKENDRSAFSTSLWLRQRHGDKENREKMTKES